MARARARPSLTRPRLISAPYRASGRGLGRVSTKTTTASAALPTDPDLQLAVRVSRWLRAEGTDIADRVTWADRCDIVAAILAAAQGAALPGEATTMATITATITARTTYRCAVLGELPLTSEEQAGLPDAELIAAALAEAHAVGLTMSATGDPDDDERPVIESDIRITTWTRR